MPDFFPCFNILILSIMQKGRRDSQSVCTLLVLINPRLDRPPWELYHLIRYVRTAAPKTLVTSVHIAIKIGWMPKLPICQVGVLIGPKLRVSGWSTCTNCPWLDSIHLPTDGTRVGTAPANVIQGHFYSARVSGAEETLLDVFRDARSFPFRTTIKKKQEKSQLQTMTH